MAYGEKVMATDWRVVKQDWGGHAAGWPSVWSDEEDRSVIHTDGFKQEYWSGPTLKEAMEIAQLVADYMNSKGAK
jgi:hypothetical protein